MTKWLISVSIALTLAAGVVNAQGDAEAGKAKSVVCAGCHGLDGNSFNPLWPKLAGQSASYITKQVNDFKAGTRKDPIMGAQAAALNDTDLADLAAYFSSQTRTTGTTAADKAALGGKVYRAGNSATGVAACMACHGPTGAGNAAAGFPGLAGQQALYVEKALKDFRSGARVNDVNNMMRGVTANMTDAEIAAVAQFVQGLQL
ncbi:MAG: cytochrome c4 [Candidatus Polarisedimenticolaceae bacterium]|nr:cytochrome c4 [Candidatus Polarisedimenticolaceae bacterium]